MWALLFLVAVVNAASNGASNCDATQHPAAMGGTDSSTGWTVVTSSSSFRPSTPLNVTISGPGGILKGLSLYVEGGGTLYGTWGTLPSGFKSNGNCVGNGVTHNSATDKSLPVIFTWTPPATNPGAATLTVRALVHYSASPRTWAVLSTTITNNFPTSAPTAKPTTAPTTAPTNGATGAPTNPAPTNAPTTVAPTTLAPTTSAPTFNECMDGIQGPMEVAIDCGGPCPPCANYSWVPDAWTPCSVPCGGGMQTRVVRCVEGTNGSTVDPSFCASLHAAETSISCNPDPCPSYSWNIGPWGVCSSACNTGTMTRTVTCLSSIGNSTVADTNCGAVTKPLTSDNCNTDPCVASRWVSLPWGICSATCGGGSQTRVVQCQTAADVVTADADCMATVKPDTQQVCGNVTCEVFVWNPCPSYYPCTASCYGGTGMLGVRYKDVFCVSTSTLQAVDASLCDEVSKPVTNFSSCNPQKCTGYNWMANGNWGACEATNGQFMRTRTFHCHAADGSVALNTACAKVPLPVASLPCVPNTCLKNVPDMVSGAVSSTVSLLLLLGAPFVLSQ